VRFQLSVSKEKVSGGYWKLQKIYLGLQEPFTATSDYEWKQHIELLKEWAAAKPNSLTAKVALAVAVPTLVLFVYTTVAVVFRPAPVTVAVHGVCAAPV